MVVCAVFYVHGCFILSVKYLLKVEVMRVSRLQTLNLEHVHVQYDQSGTEWVKNQTKTKRKSFPFPYPILYAIIYYISCRLCG